MFQYDVSEFRDFDKRQDMKDSFLAFLLTIHQDKNEFPFEYKGNTWKGKNLLFRIVGFGGYMSETGWRVYFTYRATRLNYVIQHTWRWDYETDQPIDYKCNEFVA